MASVSSREEQLIGEHQLGTVRRIYKPATLFLFSGGLFFLLFGCVVFLWPFFGFFFLGFLIKSKPWLFPLGLVWFITGILALGWGPMFIEWGIRILYKGWSTDKMRVILCTQGVVYLERAKADAFRWDQVASVAHVVVELPYDQFNRVNSWFNKNSRYKRTVPLSHWPGLGRNAWTTIYKLEKYTVKCKDKRIFVVESVLTGGKKLGETIKAEVARTREETWTRIQETWTRFEKNDAHQQDRAMPKKPHMD